MEQLLSFLLTVSICTVAVITNNPALFSVAFIIGSTYQIIRGRQKGWKLPKQIKETH